MAATNALRQLQGFPFFNKALRIDYAKTVSDAVAMTQKGWVPRHKRKTKAGPQRPEEEEDGEGAQKRIANGSDNNGAAAEQQAMVHNGAQPNKTIIASDLPENCSAAQLAILFQQYRGFKQARGVEERKLVRCRCETCREMLPRKLVL